MTQTNRDEARKPATKCGLFAMALAVVLIAGSLSWASQVRSVNLETMTERAAKIFSGRCLSVETLHDPDLGRRVTRATFEVDLAVKGDVEPVVTLTMLANPLADDAAMIDLPSYREGEEVVLFLYGESALGLTSPVGFGQGKFSVVQDKLGNRIAINEFGNRNLLQGLSPGARQTPAVVSAIRQGAGEITPDGLLNMVDQLQGVKP